VSEFVRGNADEMLTRVKNKKAVFGKDSFIPKVYETCPVVGWGFVP